MKKVATLIANMYQVLEVWYPYLRLREAEMHPVLVGVEKKVLSQGSCKKVRMLQ